MNTSHLRSLINQLQFQHDQELIEKSTYFCNKIFWSFKNSLSIGNLNYALGIQFACETLKRPVSITAFYSLAGSPKRIYDAHLIEVRKKLNIYPKIDLKAIGIRFGCEIVIDKTLDLIDQYKIKLTDSNIKINDEYFDHPSIPVACFTICCDINKIKVNQSWLQGISLMNIKEFKNLIKNIKSLIGEDINEYKLSNISDASKFKRTTRQAVNGDQQSSTDGVPTISITQKSSKSDLNKVSVNQANINSGDYDFSNIALDQIPKESLHPVLLSSLKRKKRNFMVDIPNYLETEEFKNYEAWKLETIKKLKSSTA